MNAPIDYQGIAILIGSIAGLITVVGGIAMQVALFRRTGRIEQAGTALAVVVKSVETHVNGLNQKIADGAFAQGKAAGVDQERAQPMVPADGSQNAPPAHGP